MEGDESGEHTDHGDVATIDALSDDEVDWRSRSSMATDQDDAGNTQEAEVEEDGSDDEDDDEDDDEGTKAYWQVKAKDSSGKVSGNVPNCLGLYY